ncbi:MAG: hypothetical protein KC468_15540, partial [Myxococcales bacterium]|nr:hypothetical protein [Myxococcales bacterium]
ESDESESGESESDGTEGGETEGTGDDSTGAGDSQGVTSGDGGVCGDGIVGADEECDDGDDDDADACLTSCVAAVCGDGIEHVGVEACDDGNPVDGDACTNDCAHAACGDGIVWIGVELCDDGNTEDGDECPGDCGESWCLDGVVSGDESDVDCGGDTCAPCEDGAVCFEDGDCDSSHCASGSCVTARDCGEILDLGIGDTDGPYLVDPDGAEGPGDAVLVWCEHSLEGGGWTLVFSYRKPAPGQVAASEFHAAVEKTAPLTLVSPALSSAAVSIDGLPLAEHHELLFGWGPSTAEDVTRYGHVTLPEGLTGFCFAEGDCDADEPSVIAEVTPGDAQLSITPAYTPETLHVGLVDGEGRALWGYDPDEPEDAWGNWEPSAPCCGAGATDEMSQPGWRYAIYVR